MTAIVAFDSFVYLRCKLIDTICIVGFVAAANVLCYDMRCDRLVGGMREGPSS